jgi:uncharacterized delta-60 repeat protein
MKSINRILLPVPLVLGLVFAVKPGHAAAGSLDSTFGKGGVTATSGVTGTDGIINSILLQRDGKILVFVGGTEVLRYTNNGVLDAGFGSNGIAVLPTPVGGSMALQSNGQIVVGGVVTPTTGGAALGAERLNSDGTPDTSFGNGGLAVVSLGTRSPNVGTAVLVDPNSGNILTCTTLINVGRGQPYQTALARFNSLGSADRAFGSQRCSIHSHRRNDCRHISDQRSLRTEHLRYKWRLSLWHRALRW